ncbi:hypothetical protein GGR57DRAFT_142631 [Xylariaceae sp. FL1272]|nr:hypothetical protein GGR57DRAFT_142631 [Xylariaceae sp. FL1272]
MTRHRRYNWISQHRGRKSLLRVRKNGSIKQHQISPASKTELDLLAIDGYSSTVDGQVEALLWVFDIHFLQSPMVSSDLLYIKNNQSCALKVDSCAGVTGGK